MKKIPFTVKIIKKTLGINLTKDVKDLCPENYKALLKKDWKRHNEMERYPVFMLPKAIHRLNAIPIKISMSFF